MAPVLRPEVIERIERVGDREPIEMTRRLARQEGILAGASTGTAVVLFLEAVRGSTSPEQTGRGQAGAR